MMIEILVVIIPFSGIYWYFKYICETLEVDV